MIVLAERSWYEFARANGVHGRRMSMSGLYDARISSSIGIPEVRAEYNVENGNSDPPYFAILLMLPL
jgi:hypothetical protein